jgi:hypothetical protein
MVLQQCQERCRASSCAQQAVQQAVQQQQQLSNSNKSCHGTIEVEQYTASRQYIQQLPCQVSRQHLPTADQLLQAEPPLVMEQ